MDLELSPAQKALAEEVGSWLDEHLDPTPLPTDPHESFVRRRTWQATLAGGGYVGVHWPEEHGGRGLGPIERLIVDVELGHRGAPMIAGQLGVSNIAGALLYMGTEAQKDEHLESIRTGERIWCQGMSEPDAGSDLANIRTRARLVGDRYVVDGQKIWCSDAHEADACQLYVRTDDSGRKHEGLTCLLVDMSWPGIEVRPIRTVAGEAHFNEVFFDGLEVPVDCVLGAVDRGWDVAMATLLFERSGTAALQVMLRQSFDELLRLRTDQRTQRGFADGLVRQGIGACYAEQEILKAMSLRMLSALAKGGMPGAEGSTIKLFWSEAAQHLAEVGLRVAGPLAAIVGEGAPGAGALQGSYLGSRATTIAAGTSEVNRNIISERVLAMPKG